MFCETYFKCIEKLHLLKIPCKEEGVSLCIELAYAVKKGEHENLLKVYEEKYGYDFSKIMGPCSKANLNAREVTKLTGLHTKKVILAFKNKKIPGLLNERNQPFFFEDQIRENLNAISHIYENQSIHSIQYKKRKIAYEQYPTTAS